jgi:tetratricopeptide (TPR) repeat protein
MSFDPDLPAGDYALLERLFHEGCEVDTEDRSAWLRALALAEPLRTALEGMLSQWTQDDDLVRKALSTVFARTLRIPAAGTRLGAYRLVRELGSGGNGVVFLAERADNQYEQQVAIKLMRGFGSPDEQQQLRNERQLLADLKHPNIARLIDGGETPDGFPYLVMEYVPGSPIVDACKRLDMPIERRIELVRDLAQAVHYAHQRLVIHRDIKPTNVLLRDDGRPILLDFGIAKLLDPIGQYATSTQRWFTPAYASPEQRRGDLLSTASDVYSLGLLLFELLAGRPPLPDAEGRVPAPSSVCKGARRALLPPDLDRIVLRCTAPNPLRRYPSAQVLADDLQCYLQGDPVQAMPGSLGYRLGKRLRKHPRGTVAAILAAVALALAGWRLYEESARAQIEAQAAEAATAYLVELFKELDPQRARSPTLSLEQLLDRGSHRLAKVPGLSVPSQARLRATLGENYLALGLAQKAIVELSAALAAVSPEDPHRARWLQQLGAAHLERRSYALAEASFRQAMMNRGDRSGTVLASALEGLGDTFALQGRHADAERALSRAVEIHEQNGAAGRVAALGARAKWAKLLTLMGRSDEALQLLEPALRELQRTSTLAAAELRAAQLVHAIVLRDLSRYDEAEAVLRTLLAHGESLLGPRSAFVKDVHTQLGLTFVERGRTLEAVAHMRAAYEIERGAMAPYDPAHAAVLSNLADLYTEVGDLAQAEPLLRKAASIMETQPAGPARTATRLNFGRLLMLLDRADEARHWLKVEIDPAQADAALLRGVQRLHLAEWERRFGSPQRASALLDEAERRIADLRGIDSIHGARLERTRGLIEAQAGDYRSALRDLQSARARYRRLLGPNAIAAADLSLEIAETAFAHHDPERAGRELAAAVAVLDPQLSEHAPQRRRAARLATLLEKHARPPSPSR